MTAPFIPAPASPRRPGWLVPLLAAVVVLVLAAGGVTAWALTRSSAPAPVTAAATSRAVTTTAAAVAPGPEDVACTAAEDVAEADDYPARLAAARTIATNGLRSSGISMHMQAQFVSDYADDAEAAAGRSFEDDAQRALWRAMVEFRKLCARR